MDLYQEIILDHARNPRNFGKLPDATHRAQADNVSCGDAIAFSVRIRDDIVQDIAFTGSGCAISIAGASILSEHAKGQSVETLSHMSKDAMLELLDIPIGPARMKCALLGLEALQRTLREEKRHAPNISQPQEKRNLSKT